MAKSTATKPSRQYPLGAIVRPHTDFSSTISAAETGKVLTGNVDDGVFQSTLLVEPNTARAREANFLGAPVSTHCRSARARTQADRPLPANIEAERCILASLICKAKDHAAALALSTSDFSSRGHRLIYEAIQNRALSGESTDILAVMDELGDDLQSAGGAPYLAELMTGMYVGPNITSCVRMVREKAALRDIINLGECAWTANGDASLVFSRLRILCARIEQGFEQKGKALPFESANEGAGTAETVEWLVKGYIAEGGITVLSAKIKMGKTTFATRLVQAILTDTAFLNMRTKRTPVVYLTEQPRVSFKVALQRADLTDQPDLRILYFNKTLGVPWAAVAAGAGEECKRLDAKLLIVDTLAQFAGLLRDSENDSGAVLEAVRPLQEIASRGVAVLILYHDRKSGGEVGDATRGSSALPGAADVVLSLRRPGGNSRKSLRVVQSLSRFSETPEELVIDLTDSGYIALGEKADVALQEASEAILAAAPTSEADAQTLNELCAAAAITRPTGQRALTGLVANGKILRLGAGKRGNPFRLFKPEKVSAQTSTVYEQKENLGF